jgi:putative ABC transport system permease protein
MLVSVTERTREIGTRKALGAKNAQIRLQFVTEALIITLVGGVIGLVLGIAAGAIIVSYMFDDMTIIISPLVTAGSVLFSILIGVFFGWYPANKAAKLNPIEALRYE